MSAQFYRSKKIFSNLIDKGKSNSEADNYEELQPFNSCCKEYDRIDTNEKYESLSNESQLYNSNLVNGDSQVYTIEQFHPSPAATNRFSLSQDAIGFFGDDDDSVADPNYEPDDDICDASADYDTFSLDHILYNSNKVLGDDLLAISVENTNKKSTFVASYPGPIYLPDTQVVWSNDKNNLGFEAGNPGLADTQPVFDKSEKITHKLDNLSCVSSCCDLFTSSDRQRLKRLFGYDLWQTNVPNTANQKSIIFVASYPAGPIYLTNDIHDIEELDIYQNSNVFSKGSHKEKHPMITEACVGKCKRSCSEISNEERKEIWEHYWSLDFVGRRSFLNKHVEMRTIKRRKLNTFDNEKKQESRYFYIPKDGKEIQVCRSFFLKTFGYKTDSVITELSRAVKRKTVYLGEQRGGKRKKVCVSRDIIESHIMSYNPTVSHYRRHNAPFTRYLPRYLTVKDMYTDFKTKNPDFKCSLELYRKTMKKMTISLHSPKSDACFDCLMYTQLKESNADDESLIPTEEKNAYESHKSKADSALMEYRKDALAKSSIHMRYLSMDLQKVLLLPEMPAIKDAFFMSRLIVFNLTFAPLNKDSTNKAHCVLWHEAKAARSAGNIVDAIKTFIEHERDTVHYVIWADNCTAQNKNWTLYTALVTIENNLQFNVETISIKYLTKGHTHMSADGVHGNIESKMNRQKNVFDFEDFKELVNNSRAKNAINVLEVDKFYDWPKKKRNVRRNIAAADPLKDFLLSSVVEAKFVAGSRNLFYKTNFSDSFQELDFLAKKFDVTTLPVLKTVPRGVTSSKKTNIVDKLVPLMPLNRRLFWYNLPTNDKSPDLTGHEDEFKDK